MLRLTMMLNSWWSICYNTNNWELISKYSKRFIKAGVKLRQTTFDTWMEFAVQRGYTESLWNIEKLRSETMKQHTLTTGFACAKGSLLERKPEEAAALIQVLNQTLSDAKKPGITVEFEKLVNEWPLEVIKHQKEEDRKALATSLKSDIPAMVDSLLNMGLARSVNLEDLTKKRNSIVGQGRAEHDKTEAIFWHLVSTELQLFLTFARIVATK